MIAASSIPRYRALVLYVARNSISTLYLKLFVKNRPQINSLRYDSYDGSMKREQIGV